MSVIEKIIKLEWNQFQAVHNEGGRASCQDDRETFDIMRGSQFAVWPQNLLASNKEDLEEANASGRNLLAEKYLWMMQSTYPEGFEAQKAFLPEKSYARERLEEQIVARQVRWMEEYAAKYPYLAGGGRAIHTSEDTPYDTSFETYLRGELSIYSAQTLDLYARWTEELEREGVNMSVEVMKETVARYGYKDIQAAEEHEKKKNEVSRKNT